MSKPQNDDRLLERVLEVADLAAMVSETVSLKPTAKEAELRGCCPFHDDSSPSFYVNTERGLFNCKGCGKAGNAVSYYMLSNNMTDFFPALLELADKLKVPRKLGPGQAQAQGPSPLDTAQRYYRWGLSKNEHAAEYLESRGLTKETIDKFELGFSYGGLIRSFKNAEPDDVTADLVRFGLGRQNDKGFLEYMSGRVVFPIHNEYGKLIAFSGRRLEDNRGPKYLNSGDSPVFQKGEHVYGLHQAKQAIREKGYAIVVEGYLDKIMLSQHGIDHCCSTMGTSLSPAAAEKLWANTRHIVLALDPDAAGEQGTLRAVVAAAKTVHDDKRISVLRLDGGLDPDEYVRARGSEEFLRLCESASPISTFLLDLVARQHDFLSAEDRAEYVSKMDAYAAMFEQAPNLQEQIEEEARNRAAIKGIVALKEFLRCDITMEEVERARNIAENRSTRPALPVRSRTPKP